MEKSPTQRYGLIDIIWLGFAQLVMMYHFYSGEKHFPGGYMGVEFFMILAGFLMFSAWDRNHVSTLPIEGRQHYWLDYMKKDNNSRIGGIWNMCAYYIVSTIEILSRLFHFNCNVCTGNKLFREKLSWGHAPS